MFAIEIFVLLIIIESDNNYMKKGVRGSSNLGSPSVTPTILCMVMNIRLRPQNVGFTVQKLKKSIYISTHDLFKMPLLLSRSSYFLALLPPLYMTAQFDLPGRFRHRAFFNQ